MFCSKITQGFYVSQDENGFPDDAVQISQEEYQILLTGRLNGKAIAYDENNRPFLVDAPQVSFTQALDTLNKNYQYDVDNLTKAFSVALLVDGASEETKKANIRAQYATRKTKYTSDLAALRSQYGE